MNIAALTAGLLSGVIGAMGLGGGAVLLIYLTVFKDVPQLEAQGINLLFFIPVGLLATVIYAIKKQIKWKITLPLAAGGLAGSAAGLALAGVIGGKITAKIFGGLLVVLGIKEMFSAGKNKY